jgi:hypothetical protein
MKKLFLIILLASAVKLFAQLTAADYKFSYGADIAKATMLITVDGNKASTTNYTGTGTTVVYSPIFSFGGYLSANTAAFGSTYMTWVKLHTVKVTGKPHVTSSLQGSFDQTTWTAVDTMGAVADSATTQTVGTFSYSGSYVYPYYRIATTPTASNSATEYSVYRIFCFKHD